jgi:hypothetical protein
LNLLASGDATAKTMTQKTTTSHFVLLPPTNVAILRVGLMGDPPVESAV